MTWRPASEPPTEDGPVLGFLPTISPDSPLIMVVWYDPQPGAGMGHWQLKPAHLKVTHWLPLPPRPRRRTRRGR